jgi:hypothetical protein
VPAATLNHAGKILLAFVREVGTPGSGFDAPRTSSTTTTSSVGPLFLLPPADGGAVFFDLLHTW